MLTRANTQQEQKRKNLFPVFMNAIGDTKRTKLLYTPHNRTEVGSFSFLFCFLHEMLLCKTRGAANCLSKCCQQYDVSKSENLDEKLLADV